MKDKNNDSIEKIFKQMMVSKTPTITPDDAAELLKENPELLKIFESKYQDKIKEKEESEAPLTDSKQMTSRVNKRQKDIEAENFDTKILESTISTIVKDLVNVTPIFEFNGNLADNNSMVENIPALSEDAIIDNVDSETIKLIPDSLKPQLTAQRMIKDISAEISPILLTEYKTAVEKMGTSEGMLAYHRFRQGLDIMDLDDLSYIMIAQNRNSMGKWLPQLIKASTGQNYFSIPKTTIVKLPITLLQLTKLEYNAINQTTRKILDTWAKEVFKLQSNGDYFIKTGTYSFKFDFRNVRVHDPKEIDELGEYLLYIHGYANQLAGPLYSPCIYGMSTTNEWVVREFVDSKEDAPTIYNGLPLHVEYRVFIDCDTHEVLSIHPYWDPDGMKKHFSKYAKGGNINHIHDYVVFKSYEDKMIAKYNDNKDNIVKNLQSIVDKLDLTGQWSLDIMDDGEKLWFIDMAVAEQSTFYESVPEDKRRPVLESWLPGIKPVMPPWYNNKTEEIATTGVKKLGEILSNKAKEHIKLKESNQQDTAK